MEQKKRIFISYSRKDIKLAFKIKEEIEQYIRILCWIDITGIESGNQFEHVIIDAINHSELILFFYSKNSNKSLFAEKEVRYAIANNKPVVLIRIDNSELKGWPLFNLGQGLIINYNNKTSWNKWLNQLNKAFPKKDSEDCFKKDLGYKEIFIKLWKYLKNPLYIVLTLIVGALIIGSWLYIEKHKDDSALFEVHRMHLGANHYSEIYTWTIFEDHVRFIKKINHDKTECHDDPENGFYCNLESSGEVKSTLKYENGNDGEFLFSYCDDYEREKGICKVYFDINKPDSLVIDSENSNMFVIRYVNWDNLKAYYDKRHISPSIDDEVRSIIESYSEY